MARKIRLVTRTIVITTVEVMALEVSTASVKNASYSIAGTFTPEKALEKVKALYATADFIPAQVVGMTSAEVLYGMSEEEFIAHARVLPPRSNKSADGDDEIEVEDE